MGLDVAAAAWVAGFLDGEGYFSIYARGSAGRGKPDYRPRALVRVNQAGTREPLDKLQRLLGGSTHEASRRTTTGKRVWGWQWQSAASMREPLTVDYPLHDSKASASRSSFELCPNRERARHWAAH
jgi:hypothetical protein